MLGADDRDWPESLSHLGKWLWDCFAIHRSRDMSDLPRTMTAGLDDGHERLGGAFADVREPGSLRTC